MVEYALLAALIAVIVMVAVSEVGEALVGVFERIRDEIANV
jgi:Flp pilus assembly pilin Flp